MGQKQYFDVVIIGGGTGGCAAALAASKMGKKVLLTEQTDWIGGQFTSQAVPADEHPWIEQFGCTKSYRRFRNEVREFYRRHFPLTPEAAANDRLNPGNGTVSRICADPRAALSVLNNMLSPYLFNGRLTLLTKHRIEEAATDGDEVRSVTIRNMDSGELLEIAAPYFLDATECGDVLPLAGVEYVTGAESRQQTGEPRALDGEAEPLDIQSFTYCFAMDYLEGEDHTIERPRDYAFWKEYQPAFYPFRQLGWLSPIGEENEEHSLFPQEGAFTLWTYRRLIDRSLFAPGTFDGELTLVNWPQNDYYLGSIYEVDDAESKKHHDQAKQLSLSLLYWLQTEAPRPDGGYGYPGLRLRKDVVGTEDGLAKHPYIRESRRIKAEFTVLEQHVNPECRQDHRGETFKDSVGVGCYGIDLHTTTAGRKGTWISGLPFQIPLGSLIPIRIDNLLPACKNIGVTHITNGCYRLHPTEWNIGEASGYLAAYCIDKQVIPRVVRNTPELLQDFQHHLVMEGVEIDWPQITAFPI